MNQQQILLLTESQMVFDDNNESKTNLIVNYLPQTFSYDELRNLFGHYGELESCKLVYDKLTGQSLCYGFVNFLNIEDADQAAGQLNGIKLQNKQIKVSFARPSCEAIKGTNLYVSGLPKGWTTNEFNQFFSQCGKIITSRVLNNPVSNQPKGVGFIRFDQRYEAEYAIQKLNGILPIFTPNDQMEQNQVPLVVKFANFSDNILTGMPAQTDFYQKNKLAVYRTMPTPIPMATYNYTRYAAPIEYANPIAIYSKATNDCPVIPAAAAAASYLPPGTGWCLFVYNLSPDTEDNILWQLFGPFGAVQNIKLIRDYQNKKCKGFGFITMTNYEEADVGL